MSPESRAALASLTILHQELEAARSAMSRHEAQLASLLAQWEPVGRTHPWLTVAAVAVHGWYTALESAFERVARTLEGTVPTGPQSHSQLLAQMAMELPSIRPALLSAPVANELRSLLKFRHFFRHAYNVELNADLLEQDCRRLVRLAPEVRQSLDDFDAFLNQAIEELSRSP